MMQYWTIVKSQQMLWDELCDVVPHSMRGRMVYHSLVGPLGQLSCLFKVRGGVRAGNVGGARADLQSLHREHRSRSACHTSQIRREPSGPCLFS